MGILKVIGHTLKEILSNRVFWLENNQISPFLEEKQWRSGLDHPELKVGSIILSFSGFWWAISLADYFICDNKKRSV